MDHRIISICTGLALVGLLTHPANSFALPPQLPDPDANPASTNKPVKVFVLAGQSNMVGMGKVTGDEPGTLTTLTQVDGLFPHLLDDQTNWTVRSDVYFYEARVSNYPYRQGDLTVGLGAGTGEVGPELQFGHLMGHAFDEQVVLIKSAIGNRSLGWDFRPPSSGSTSTQVWEGLEYELMIEGVSNVVNNLDTLLPGYVGQGYEITGFVWFQGHKDGLDTNHTAEYEMHLTNLIQDVRAAWEVPDLPVAIATVGFRGNALSGAHLKIHEAQMAVSGDQGNYPGYAGNVLTVDTRDFWREVNESPRNEDYHYNRNAETYVLIGDALGRAMYGLLAPANTPPSPDPMRFMAPPEAVDANSIKMQAGTAYDPATVEYYFENTTNGHVRGWDASRVWTDTNLTEGATYGYRVKARDVGANTTQWSTVSLAVPEPDLSVQIFSENFESPVVSNFVAESVPTANWIGATDGFGAGSRGLINENANTFTTPDGNQAYRLYYGNSALTTTNDLGVLTLDTVYTITFNAATIDEDGNSLYDVQLVTFDEGEDRASTYDGDAEVFDGVVSSTNMSDDISFQFSPGLDHPNLGKPIAIRLEGHTGHNTLIDNVRLATFVPPETTPPSPNPATFELPPYALNATTLVARATLATDVHGSYPVQYYFENTNTLETSGWTLSRVWTNEAVTEGETYGVRVRARDAVSNETFWSDVAMVLAEDDLTAPTPDKMTFAQAPLGIGASSIYLEATEAWDISNPIEYEFENVSNGHARAWSTDRIWVDEGLVRGRTYGYRVRARDARLNPTAWSDVTNGTPANRTGQILYESFESPVVEGYQINSVPQSGWVGSGQGYNSSWRGLFNEGDEMLFSTPFGEQGFLLDYTNTGLTTEEGVLGILRSNVTYTVSFNVAVRSGQSGGYSVELAAFDPNADRTECRGQRPGTVLVSLNGDVTTSNMLHAVSFDYMAEHGDPSVGKDLGLRFLRNGEAIYDNVLIRSDYEPTYTAPVLIVY